MPAPTRHRGRAGSRAASRNGAPVVARVAMKPLATLNRPVLETVDVVTKESTVCFKERTDVTAVPAMGVVAETMTALVLAAEALRKFGGDSVAEVVRNRDGYLAAWARRRRLRRAAGRAAGTAGHRRRRARMTPRILLVGMMGAGKTTAGRLLAGAPRAGRYRDSDADGRGGHRPDRARALRRATARRPSGPSEADVLAEAPAPRPTRRWSPSPAAPCCDPDNRRLIAGERHRRLAPGPARDAGRPGGRRRRPPAARRRPGRAPGRASTPSARPLYAEVADVVVDVDDLAPDEVVDRILAGRSTADAAGAAGAGRDRPVRALSVDLADRSYAVLVGAGRPPRAGARSCRPAPSRPRSCTQEAIRTPAGSTGSTPGVPVERAHSSPTARRPSRSPRSRTCAAASPGPGSPGPTWSWPSAGAW